jgi:eukaryotic translation initiation factor 2C
LEIIDKLQIQQAKTFNPRAAFDGRRNMFRSVPLELANNSDKFEVYMGDTPAVLRGKSKPLIVRITKVAEVNPGCVRYLRGSVVI